MTPNSALQRSGTHKLLGRGRFTAVLEQVMRARVLIRWRAAAELGSQAALMAIRKLLPEDAAAFQAIRLRGLLEIPSAFSSSHEEEVGTPVTVIAQRLAPKADGSVLGAFQGATLTGVIGIQREAQKQLAHKAIIWGMYVLPEFRLKGVGRSLVSKALDIAAQELGVRAVNLGVNAQNEAAVALYTSMGFRTYGTETGFLMIDGKLYDEYLMTKLVSGAA